MSNKNTKKPVNRLIGGLLIILSWGFTKKHSVKASNFLNCVILTCFKYWLNLIKTIKFIVFLSFL